MSKASITSAVLVPIFINNNEPSLLFTKRNRHMKHHPGEVSFPGGRLELGETPLQAAKRETLEEINCKVIKILDTLNPVMTLVSDHLILPYIGIIETNNIKPNPAEVEELHCITLDELKKVKLKKKRHQYENIYISSPIWNFRNFYVWGATGRILVDFKNWLIKNDVTHIPKSLQ